MLQPHLPRQVVLRNKEEKRITAGHPWAFSNEVRETRGSPAPGDVVELVAASGLSLGVGLYNPHSLIAVRLLSGTVVDIDQEFFRRRISAARDLRERLYPGETVYRLVHGEGDFLPGLVIDRYNDQFAVQAVSIGMDMRLPLVCDVLRELFQPSCILARNDSPLRALENLPAGRTVLYGEPSPTMIDERGIRYTVDMRDGQKTGFFLDQRENRGVLERFSAGRRILDAFCNDGGFALSAGRAGAASVVGIDISPEAVARARANAILNGITAACFEEADVFPRLKELAAEGKTFDVVVLDPPSFTRSRKNVQAARKGYRNLHAAALPLIPEGGLLMTASCSHHILPDVFREIVDGAARTAGRRLQLLEWRGAAPDHPVLPSVPETAYLKMGLFRVL
ncbi:MAG TPA: class I SAM-dependent rRNA methyltransferase [Bacteroidota bacterium]|nr:class I SAM-dependent rRNA methyltransferase [Bacteroidota bacterium]